MSPTAPEVTGGVNVEELRRALSGPVLGPDDDGYDAARRCFNALVDRRPSVIARCLGAEDVATALGFARAHELEVAVRGGGHNPAGHCVCDGGLVVDLSLMRQVEVDGDARLARAAGGATWLAVEGRSATEIRDVLGHTQTSMTDHYMRNAAILRGGRFGDVFPPLPPTVVTPKRIGQVLGVAAGSASNSAEILRRGRDSNPRSGFPPTLA